MAPKRLSKAPFLPIKRANISPTFQLQTCKRTILNYQCNSSLASNEIELSSPGRFVNELNFRSDHLLNRPSTCECFRAYWLACECVFELDTIKYYATTIAHCLCLLISKFRVRFFACLLAEFNVSHLVTTTLSGIDFDRLLLLLLLLFLSYSKRICQKLRSKEPFL